MVKIPLRIRTIILNEQGFIKLVSGESQGFKANVLRFALGVLAYPYELIIRVRNFLYSKHILKRHEK